jgi:hypothetical protein
MNRFHPLHSRLNGGALTLALVAAILAPLDVSAQIGTEKTLTLIESGPWNGPRLPDGQPDIQGHWSNTIGNHDNFTDPQGGIPGDPDGAGGGGAAAIGSRRAETPRSERAPSRVTDPADGQPPFQPWARAIQQELLANFFHPTREEYVDPFARCAPGGPIKSFYWHGYEIRQYPGYILFIFASSSRLIHLDDKPHLPENIKLWNGDSRGHWEGNTLVVDVTNDNGKARLARTGEFYTENAHITERFVFDDDGRRFTYYATIDDPTAFTQPWTVTVPAIRYDESTERWSSWHYEAFPAEHDGPELIHEVWERTCVENNEGHGEVALPQP